MENRTTIKGENMKEVTVTTQKQFDKISLNYDGIIHIVSGNEWLNISARPRATIYVSGSATIKSVSGSATIESVSDSVKAVIGKTPELALNPEDDEVDEEADPMSNADLKVYHYNVANNLRQTQHQTANLILKGE
jgi:hypothetical protein